MPSGAKKRKAAKKKKEMEAHINPVTNNSQGNDDLRFQNEKGSDGSEVDSPAHQDHHNHQHPFNEGNKELEERDPAATPSLVTAEKSMEEVTSIVEGAHTVGVEDDGVVNIGRDFKSDETSGIKEVNIEQVESNKESHLGDDRSSSSSSDDESLLSEKKSKEEYNSVPVAIIPDNLVKTVDSSSAKVDLITENMPVEETVNSVTNVSSVVDSVMPVVSESKVTTHVTGSVSIEKSVEAKGTPTVVSDVALKRTEDTIFCSSDENAKVSTGLVESKPNVYEGKDLTSSGTTSIQSSNGTEHVKDSGSLDFSENQPLVAHAPGAVQKTSWLSCCGLLEVVTTGSSR
ncbi:Cell wall integrity and stress response component 4 like [Quillaja saponaria]|uniref:Cell wall integrity and stress response component 4 like n=1 Tax=Quillaja saponaria TaxID=32244 RepID=A0AAD7M2M9_QUISA|nr:Cell wall integrity and stress response component 4 like [Quillaja saponaria]KAJ7968841.1 Cell wall integrity and stress response component 4 like [Quillaja saponaria]